MRHLQNGNNKFKDICFHISTEQNTKTDIVLIDN